MRRTVAALRSGGYEVDVLCPAAGGAALVGPGPSEARQLIDWERADVAALLSEPASAPDSLRQDLARYALAIAFTRSEPLARGLRAIIPRVLVHDPHPPPRIHAARWLASPVLELGLDALGDPPPLRATVRERRQARPWWDRLPPRFLAVHPGSGSPRKNWPADRWPALIEALRPPRPWLVVRGPAEAGPSGPLRAPDGALVAESLPVRVLGAILSRAGAFIGNDSGVSHLAAAFGAPTVALFGPTEAVTWAPEGPWVRALQSPTGEMQALALSEVVSAVGSLGPLRPTRRRRRRGRSRRAASGGE
jgi:hypothetical protein